MQSLLEKLAHVATVLATIIALSAFAVTTIAGNQRSKAERLETLQDTVLIGLIANEPSWDRGRLQASFTSELANHSENTTLTAQDIDGENFTDALARLLISGSVTQLDEQTIALTSFAQTARSLQAVDNYVARVSEEILDIDENLVAIYSASSEPLPLPTIIERAAGRLRHLTREEVADLIQEQVDSFQIARLIPREGTPPPTNWAEGIDPNAPHYQWLGAPPRGAR